MVQYVIEGFTEELQKIAYTIAKGDTLGGLAKKFGMSVADLMAANKGIKDPNKIFAGKNLNIPGKAAAGGLEGQTRVQNVGGQLQGQSVMVRPPAQQYTANTFPARTAQQSRMPAGAPLEGQTRVTPQGGQSVMVRPPAQTFQQAMGIGGQPAQPAARQARALARPMAQPRPAAQAPIGAAPQQMQMVRPSAATTMRSAMMSNNPIGPAPVPQPQNTMRMGNVGVNVGAPVAPAPAQAIAPNRIPGRRMPASASTYQPNVG